MVSNWNNKRTTAVAASKYMAIAHDGSRYISALTSMRKVRSALVHLLCQEIWKFVTRFMPVMSVSDPWRVEVNKSPAPPRRSVAVTLAVSDDTRRIEMKCAFPGPIATRCCSCF